MDRPACSDKEPESLMKRTHVTRKSSQRDRESGQAMVEFALILFPLLILVVGVIQFGIGLNYWLDMNRLANQGARWAVVNGWPNCPRTQTSACASTTVGPSNDLQTYLEAQATSKGLRDSVTITVCYPDDGDASPDGEVGDPVKVKIDAPLTFRAIMKLGTLDLSASATMRRENNIPFDHLTGTVSCP